MKRINPKEFRENSFIATIKEIEEDECQLGIKSFDGLCDFCGNNSDIWFIFKECGSGSMDSWICFNCVKKIKKLMEEVKKDEVGQGK